MSSSSSSSPSPLQAQAPVQAQSPTQPAPAVSGAAAKRQPASSAPSSPARPAETSVRVRTTLLDNLIEDVSELVVLRNQIDRLAEGAGNDVLTHAAHRLHMLTGELQDRVLRTRMQPVDSVFSGLPRLVRDLANACGRQVRLELSGHETEADRSLLEAVRDPLTHLVRNAVDHGIEPPADRVAAGKDITGNVTVQAIHSGGHVVIEVADDGRGIDPDKVAAKAVATGRRTAAQIAAMSRTEILELLFEPGMSTADTVSTVSGRGVGMDVVRTNVEEVGGTVDFDSTPGRGTTWHLRVPLTVAVMPVLTVECAGHVLALSQVTLRELVTLRPDGRDVEQLGTAPVYRLRDELLPVVRLDGQLGLRSTGPDGGILVVLKAHGRRFGLVVDRVLSTGEVVVNPLARHVRQVGLYSGATVLGDGRVALILDAREIARRSHLVRDVAPALSRSESKVPAAPVEQMLVAGTRLGRRVAAPLRAVRRIERVAPSRLEPLGRHEVLRMREGIVPVVRLDRVVGEPVAPDPDELVVVLYQRDARTIALVVDAVLDIVDDDRGRHSAIEDTGLLGATVLDDHVTGLLDGAALVAAVEPTFYGDDGAADALRELVGR
ncbi:chemotaxis protein CheA [Georgenia subflava]|uniref:histidine kinase n=3 Tax=Georgenia subflava TaxID=1622177 RepID=A0A6N7ENX0_9MICO|nr:chemotaxis protein CheA [Georgenia subflava]